MSKKKGLIIVYYLLLFLVLALYTDLSQSPNIIIRLGYLAALVIPLYSNLELLPAVFVCALGITKNTFAYPFLPTESYYYVLLALVFAVISLLRKRKLSVTPFFVIILVYVAINDVLLQNHFSNLAVSIFLILLFHLCFQVEPDTSLTFLPFAFIIITIVLSYWVLFFKDVQVIVYNSAGDMDQMGWMDPNYCGCVLGAGLVLSIRELLFTKNTKVFVFFHSIVIIVALLALLRIGSRGVLISLAIATVFLVSSSRVRFSTKLILIIVSLVLFVFLLNNHYLDLIIARFNNGDQTGSHRTEIWASKLNGFFSNDGNLLKLVFGYGQEEGLKLGSYKLSSAGTSAHNDFIGILVYYGLFGLALLLMAFAYPVKICSSRSTFQIIALLAYLFVCSMTIEPLSHGNIVYIGMLYYTIQLARQSKTSTKLN